MNTRRDFLKKAAYAAPVIMTLTARPSFASGGSGYSSDGPKVERSRTSKPKKKKERGEW